MLLQFDDGYSILSNETPEFIWLIAKAFVGYHNCVAEQEFSPC
jgi:hypothetical protein